MKKERMSVGMGLNLLLLMAMVAANILSFYHLSSTRSLSPSSLHLRSQQEDQEDAAVPDHLLRQLHTIRATISRLQQQQNPSSSSISPPPELLLFSRLSPIASACSDNPLLLHRFMNYTPFSLCPADSSSLAESLMLRGCHPLPRRRCLTRGNIKNSDVKLEKDDSRSNSNLLSSKSALDLTLPQLLTIARAAPGASPLTLALDVGGGSASLSSALRTLAPNVTVLTTTMNLGSPNSETAARKGCVPLHLPLQQRFPVADGAVDLVRTGHGVNRWIPEAAMEFLVMDVDRVLRGGGLFWVDHFSCRAGDLERVYGRMIGRLGYKRIKWAVGNKTDGNGVKFGEVYLTALLQKPAAAKM